MAAPLKSLSSNRCRLWPLYVQVRYKFNTKKDKRWATKMPRRIFDAVTAPILPRFPKYSPLTCQPAQKSVVNRINDEPNPYEEFLIRQQKKLFEESQMIIVCQLLPCHPIRFRKIRVPLEREGMKITFCNNRHAKQNIAGTKLEAMVPWLEYKNVLITSPDIRVRELMKVDKQFPEMIILGGFVSDRLVRRHELQHLATLPSVDAILGDFAYGLNRAGGGNTVTLLDSPQQTLSVNLDQLVKQSEEGSETSVNVNADVQEGKES